MEKIENKKNYKQKIKEFLKKDIEGFKKNWQPFKEEGKKCIKELKNKETRKKQIPNLLTASRLLSPIFIIPTALSGNIMKTFMFTTLFAATDALDGHFARKYNSTSEFGRELDPLTDKIFALSLLIPLLTFNPLLIGTLGLELLISGINLHSRLNDNKPKTNWIGKIKTGALSLTILLSYILMLLHQPSTLITQLIKLTMLLQASAAVKYYLSYKKDEKDKCNNNNNNETKKVDKIKEIKNMTKEKTLELKNKTATSIKKKTEEKSNDHYIINNSITNNKTIVKNPSKESMNKETIQSKSLQSRYQNLTLEDQKRLLLHLKEEIKTDTFAKNDQGQTVDSNGKVIINLRKKTK